MSGSSPQPSKPFQGPQFDLANNFLNSWVLGNAAGANPNLMGPVYSDPSLQGQAAQIGLAQAPAPSQNMPGVYGGGNSLSRPGMGGATYGQSMQSLPNRPTAGVSNLTPYGQRVNNGGYSGANGALKPQGFTQAGQNINGQMFSNTTIAPPNADQINFTQRNPFQFTQPDRVNINDTYTPQYQLASRDILDQGNKTKEQLLSDMNKRGMLTTGAATKAMFLNAQEQDRKLANLASQYSIEQGRAQLQEDQMRRQLEMQRQTEQAAEIFRQQGATDSQAQFLAQNALQNAQLRTSQQSQQFNQNLQGRQQGMAEEQLANLMRRQPLEDLFKLWQQQAGATGPTQGSPGIMGILGPIAGAAAGSFIPGIGTAAGMGLGSAVGGAAGSMF